MRTHPRVVAVVIFCGLLSVSARPDDWSALTEFNSPGIQPTGYNPQNTTHLADWCSRARELFLGQFDVSLSLRSDYMAGVLSSVLEEYERQTEREYTLRFTNAGMKTGADWRKQGAPKDEARPVFPCKPALNRTEPRKSTTIFKCDFTSYPGYPGYRGKEESFPMESAFLRISYRPWVRLHPCAYYWLPDYGPDPCDADAHNWTTAIHNLKNLNKGSGWEDSSEPTRGHLRKPGRSQPHPMNVDFGVDVGTADWVVVPSGHDVHKYCESINGAIPPCCVLTRRARVTLLNLREDLFALRIKRTGPD